MEIKISSSLLIKMVGEGGVSVNFLMLGPRIRQTYLGNYKQC